MSGPRPPELLWEAFRAEIATIAAADPATVAAEARLIEDLGLDSVALAELVGFLVGELGMTALDDELADRRWNDLTAGALYDEYVQQQANWPAT